MKRLFIFTIFWAVACFLLYACGSESNVNVTANRAANTNTNSNSGNYSVANSAGNAYNAVANTVSNAMGSGKPEDFMVDAAKGGAAEVQLGNLALQKSKNPDVRKFAQMMVDDHTKAGNELKELAAKKKVTLPNDIGSSKSTADKLQTLNGADFDKEYVEDMVSDHEKDVAEFQKQANSASDPDVKAWAAKTLPTLKKHLDAIKAIQAKMK